MKFLRRDSFRTARLGGNIRKKKKWRKPTGRDNKMREKRRGYPAVVSIGYRKARKLRDTNMNKNIVLVSNIEELQKIDASKSSVIFAKIGKRKRIEMLKIAQSKGIHVMNIRKETGGKK
jgi:large subunit ribosomal protein L32e